MSEKESFKLIGKFQFSLVDNQFNCIILSNGEVFEEYDNFLKDSKIENVFLSIKINNIFELSLLQVFLWQHRQEFFFPSNITIIIQQLEFGVEESINIPEYWLCMPTLAVQMGFEVLSLKNVDDKDILTNKYENKCSILHQIIIYSNYVKFDTDQIDSIDNDESIQFQFSKEQINHQLTATTLLQRLALNLQKNKKFAHLLPIVLAWNAYQLIQDTKKKTYIHYKREIQKEIHFSQEIYQTGVYNSQFQNLLSVPIHLLQLEIFNETNLPLFQKMCDVSYLFKVEFFALYSYGFGFDRSVLSQSSRSGKSVTLYSLYYFQLLVGNKVPIFINLGYDKEPQPIQILYNRTSINLSSDMNSIFHHLYELIITSDYQITTRNLYVAICEIVCQYQKIRQNIQSQIVQKLDQFMSNCHVFLVLKQYLFDLTRQQINIDTQIDKILSIDLFQLEQNDQLQNVKVSDDITSQDYIQYLKLNNMKQKEVLVLIDECLQPQKNSYISCMSFIMKLTYFYYEQILNQANYDILKKFQFENLTSSQKIHLIKLFPKSCKAKIDNQVENNPLPYKDQDQKKKKQQEQNLEDLLQLQKDKIAKNDEVDKLQITKSNLKIEISVITDKQLQKIKTKQKQNKQLTPEELIIYDVIMKLKDLQENIQKYTTQLNEIEQRIEDQIYFNKIDFDLCLKYIQEFNQQTFYLMLFKESDIFIEIFQKQPTIFDQISILSPNIMNMKDLCDNFKYFSSCLSSFNYENCETQFQHCLYHYIMIFFNPRCCETIFWRNFDVISMQNLEHLQQLPIQIDDNMRVQNQNIQKIIQIDKGSINSYSSTLLAAGTDMAIVNFIRQQQALYQCSNSQNLSTYTLCSLVGGAQLHPSKMDKSYYEFNQINYQSFDEMKKQVESYESYLKPVNIFMTMLPELQGELQFLCPLISPQLLIKHPQQAQDQMIHYCYNYCNQFSYNINDQLHTEFQIQSYQQLYGSIRIYRDILPKLQYIQIDQQVLQLKNKNYVICQKEIIKCQNIDNFYSKLKILASSKINSDAKLLFSYNISLWIIKMFQSEVVQEEINLLKLYLKNQQLTEAMSGVIFLLYLCGYNGIDKILTKLNYDNVYLSFYTLPEQIYIQIDSDQKLNQCYWQSLISEVNKTQCKFLILNQSFDLLIHDKNNKNNYIDQTLKLAYNSYHRLKELMAANNTDQSITQMAILVKIDFPNVSPIILENGISLPDYVLAIFGLEQDVDNPILFYNVEYCCCTAAFESGNHTSSKLFSKINNSQLKTIIQCSSLKYIDDIARTFQTKCDYNKKTFYKLFERSNQIRNSYQNNLGLIFSEKLNNIGKLNAIYVTDKEFDIKQTVDIWINNQINQQQENIIIQYLKRFKKVDLDQEMMKTVNFRLFELCQTIGDQLNLVVQQARCQTKQNPKIKVQLINLNNNSKTDANCELTVHSILCSLGNHIILNQKYESETIIFGVIYVDSNFDILQKWIKNQPVIEQQRVRNQNQLMKIIQQNQEIIENLNLSMFKIFKTFDQQVQHIIQEVNTYFGQSLSIEFKNYKPCVEIEEPTLYSKQNFDPSLLFFLLRNCILFNYKICSENNKLTLEVVRYEKTSFEIIDSWLVQHPKNHSKDVQSYLKIFRSLDMQDFEIEESMKNVDLQLFLKYPTVQLQIESIIIKAQSILESKEVKVQLLNLNNNSKTDANCELTVHSILCSLGNHIILNQKYESETIIFGVIYVDSNFDILQKWIKNQPVIEQQRVRNQNQLMKIIQQNQEIIENLNLSMFKIFKTFDQQVQHIIQEVNTYFGQSLSIEFKNYKPCVEIEEPTLYSKQNFDPSLLFFLLRNCILFNYKICSENNKLTLEVVRYEKTSFEIIDSWLVQHPKNHSKDVQSYLKIFRSLDMQDFEIEESMKNVDLQLFLKYPTVQLQIESIIIKAQSILESKEVKVQLLNLNNNSKTDANCELTVHSILCSLGNHIILNQKYESETIIFGVIYVDSNFDILQKWIKNQPVIEQQRVRNQNQLMKIIQQNQEIIENLNLSMFKIFKTFDQQVQHIIQEVNTYFGQSLSIEFKNYKPCVEIEEPTLYSKQNFDPSLLFFLLRNCILFNYKICSENNKLTLEVVRYEKTSFEIIDSWLVQHPKNHSKDVQSYLKIFRSLDMQDFEIEESMKNVDLQLFLKYPTVQLQIESIIIKAQSILESKEVKIQLLNLKAMKNFNQKIVLMQNLSVSSLMKFLRNSVIVGYNIQGEFNVIKLIVIKQSNKFLNIVVGSVIIMVLCYIIQLVFSSLKK